MSDRYSSTHDFEKSLKESFITGLKYFLAAALLIVIATAVGCRQGQQLDKQYTVWGKVESVTRCSASKRHLECLVDIGGYHAFYADITRYPGDMIQIGDTLGSQYVVYEHGESYGTCRNGYCLESGVCMHWMPCYGEDSKERLVQARKQHKAGPP